MFVLRRRAARVVLLDPEDRVLLLAAHDPADRAKGSWWEIPGGGMAPGEDSAQAAHRELVEETGVADVEMGPCVWTQHVAYSFAGLRFDQQEHIHLARCAGGTYRPAGLEGIEAVAFEGGRWWTLPELAGLGRGTDGSGAGGPGAAGTLLPPWLPDELPRVLAEGLPAQPIDLGDVPSPWE